MSRTLTVWRGKYMTGRLMRNTYTPSGSIRCIFQ